TFMPLILNGAITTLTYLDFLGFGLPPGSPSLGEMLSQGQTYLRAPWLGITAFMLLAVTLSLRIFIGGAAWAAYDPRKTFAPRARQRLAATKRAGSKAADSYESTQMREDAKG